MTRKTSELTIVTLRVVEETFDDDHPSLPPFPVVEATGQTVSETIRPLAKVLPFAAKLRRIG